MTMHFISFMMRPLCVGDGVRHADADDPSGNPAGGIGARRS
jgi:hypothetical protein